MAHSANQAMSDPTRSPHPSSGERSPLAQWLNHHGQQLHVSMTGHVRGHSLHVLCELCPPSDNLPPSQRVVHRYFQSHVDGVEINQRLGSNSPSVRHLWLYGRVKGAKQPAWTVSMPLVLTPPHRALPYQHGVSQIDSLQGDNLQGDNLQGDNLQGDSLQGDSLQGDNLQGEKTSDASLATVSPQTDWYTLAEQGHPPAIAHYLHYILADLGVRAKIGVKVQRDRPNTAKGRLWITCRASYCPAAALVGQPIARQLRALSLANIEDAILRFQVSGEDTPDWVLRIDLTPQEDMLKEWARWGDVEAISRLVNQRLQPCQSQLIEATLKDTTLHLSCAAVEPTASGMSLSSSGPKEPANTDVDAVASADAAVAGGLSIPATITKLLANLAPQGIHSAVVYGQQAESTTPAWVEWMDLPAKDQLDRAVTPLELATNGDGEAIAFLLRRLLNPDLNTQLATGGIRIQVLTKTHAIHVMCDAPLCPAKDDVVPKMERLLQSLDLPGIKGIRLYGRRAGQRQPRWHHAIDFGSSPSMVPEPTPQFAATDAYVTELVTPTSEPMLRPDLTPSELWSRWQVWRQRLVRTMRRSLLSTHLFVPTADSPELMLRSTPRHATLKTAVVWAAVGALALVQTDLGLNQLARFSREGPTMAAGESNPEALPTSTPGLSSAADPIRDVSAPFPLAPSTVPPATDATRPTSEPQAPVTETSPIESLPNAGDSIFDASEFTGISEPTAPSASPLSPAPVPLQPQGVPPQPQPFQAIPNPSVATSELSTTLASSPYPSFNSDQLDYKLALYYQRLLDVGPPDVLILGSSRALRGVNPVVLEQALAELGYVDADVFNFGINGATAQVVELILQEILLPEQLPKLIIWADGARAFNSGRDDRTYNGILASEGYEQLLDGSLVRPSVVAADLGRHTGAIAPGNVNDLARSLSNSYQALDEHLSDWVASVSMAYDERDRIKTIVQQGLTTLFPHPPNPDNGLDGAMAMGQQRAQPGINTHDFAANGSNNGNQATTSPLPVDAPTSLSAIDNIDNDGFLPLSVRFDPTQYYQQYARVSGNYDRDYSNFQLEGRQGDALQTLVGLGQTYDIPIVFINMPLTQEYLDPFRITYEQTFRQYMLNVALQQESFIFRDLGPLWLEDTNHRSYFSDPSHLNQYGAYEVSHHISKDPMIPWDATAR